MARRALGPLLAVAVFGVATAWVYGELWRRGADRTLAVVTVPGESSGAGIVRRADATFEAWLVARNARALTTRPHRLFHAEHCAPAERSLALGIPMIAMGAIAIPFWYASGNPILTYNLALVTLALLAACAMYGLVTSWTGRPAAGVVAGLLFAFHPIRIGDVTHPSVWDSSWAVFAIWFAERLCARGRWRDALGLSAAIALQIAASFYPLLAATFGLAPFGLWLLLWRRPLRASPAQLACVALLTAAAAAAVLAPYLTVETEGGPLRRANAAYASLASYLPGGRFSPGALLLALAALGVARPRRRPAALRIEGDPRIPLLIGALLAVLVAAGPHLGHSLGGPLAGLDLYGFFGSFLPGLGAVRGVMRLTQGALLVFALLAGIAAAELLRRAGRFAPLAAAALIGLAALDVLRPPLLGFEPRYHWAYQEAEPDAEAIEFFAELERLGNEGALLELPLWLRPHRVAVATRRILQTTWHGRRTSACYGSYHPASRRKLAELAGRLPEPSAIRELAALGFTTVVLETGHEGRLPLRSMVGLHRAAKAGHGLTLLHRTRRRVAYALRPETLPTAPRARRAR